jgi:hypothetical protein
MIVETGGESVILFDPHIQTTAEMLALHWFRLQWAEVNMVSRKRNSLVGRRTAKRIHLRIPFQVSGTDVRGFHFLAEAKTLNVCSKGGCLVLDKDVIRGETLKLTSPKGLEFNARVCWSSYEMHNDTRYVGFAIMRPIQGWVLTDRASLVGRTSSVA